MQETASSVYLVMEVRLCRRQPSGNTLMKELAYAYDSYLLGFADDLWVHSPLIAEENKMENLFDFHFNF